MRFGEYDLVERIAVGGMAEIYKARVHRPGGIGKTLCIKRVHPKYCADPSFREMFLDEARIGVSLSHGNIVPVFDFGSIDGMYYLAMEYVEGRDLAQVAGRARLVGLPMPKEVAAHLVSEVLEGLHYAHERTEESGRALQIVLDISPSNLLVSKTGEVKILDFGIARAAIREFETRTGVVKGTPGYMSPEQLLGGNPDRRADVYSAGIVLWELLANERHASDRIDPPSPTGDVDLDAIVAKATAVNPEGRYGSARDMKDALDSLLVARGVRPGARELSAYVDAVLAAAAPEEDWRYRQSGPGTEPLGDEERSSPSEPARTRPVRPPSSGPPPRTERITRPGFARRRAALIAVALLGLGGAATAAVVVGGGDDPALPRTTAPAPTAVPATLVVTTLPPGAEVAIDGDVVGRSDWTGDDLAPGDHVVRVKLDGYRQIEKTVALRSGERREEPFTLDPITGILRIETEPAGADVSIDGTPRGKAPVSLDLPPGPHRIVATLAGRPTVRRDETVFANRSMTVTIPIPAAAPPPPLVPARLWVNTHIAWGQVLLDGRFIGNTPVGNHPVAPGTHTVVVRNPTHGEKRWSVNLRPGQELRLVLPEWPAR